MLRIVPTSDEELQKVQELQDLEELQVPGVALGTPPSTRGGIELGKGLGVGDGPGCGMLGTSWCKAGQRRVRGGAAQGRI